MGGGCLLERGCISTSLQYYVLIFQACMMFRRKLKAIDYHSADDVDVTNPHDLKALVIWLEDQKIRHYKIDERGDLRSNTGANWTATFKKYLVDLECPHDVDTNFQAAVDWLLGVAVRYEYGDASRQHPELKQGLALPNSPAQKPTSSLPTSSKSPLDIDPSNEVFRSGVQALAKILQVTSHPDPSVLLEAVRIVMEEKLSQTALEAVQQAKPEEGVRKAKKKYNITPKDCGFDLGDPVLSEAAKVLRLLHIQELRTLQTHINELIVAVQAITANPKTDQSLGRVGK